MSEEKIKKILDENTTAEELVVFFFEELKGVVGLKARAELAYNILRELDIDTALSESKKKYSEKLIIYILAGLAYGAYSVKRLRGIVEDDPIMLKKKAKGLEGKKELEEGMKSLYKWCCDSNGELYDTAIAPWVVLVGVQRLFWAKEEGIALEKKIEEEKEKRVKCIYDLLTGYAGKPTEEWLREGLEVAPTGKVLIFTGGGREETMEENVAVMDHPLVDMIRIYDCVTVYAVKPSEEWLREGLEAAQTAQVLISMRGRWKETMEEKQAKMASREFQMKCSYDSYALLCYYYIVVFDRERELFYDAWCRSLYC